MRAVLQGITLGAAVTLLATTNLRAKILSSHDAVARSIIDHRAELGVAQKESHGERHRVVIESAEDRIRNELRHLWNSGVFCAFAKLSSRITPPSSSSPSSR